MIEGVPERVWHVGAAAGEASGKERSAMSVKELARTGGIAGKGSRSGPGRRAGLLGALALTAALGGCGSTEPSYYGLVVAPGQPQPSLLVTLPQYRVIEVRMPSLPMRLDRDTIVMGSKDFKLNLARGTSWNEPPANLIGGTLVQDLQQRLPGSVVYLQDSAVTTPPQSYVDLSINQFESLPDGRPVITGILSIRKGGILPQPACSQLLRWSSPQPVSTAQALVAALSQGMGYVADQAIVALRGLNSCPSTGSTKPVSELQKALTQAVQVTTAASEPGN
ncbi:membrane integrity-associated transporter subunit PqiC [Oecophyllibacter saccharovorans]|nr:membrane integrity-associated transporter subunit PqiC [Oecophyllibacter saccharovorans]